MYSELERTGQEKFPQSLLNFNIYGLVMLQSLPLCPASGISGPCSTCQDRMMPPSTQGPKAPGSILGAGDILLPSSRLLSYNSLLSMDSGSSIIHKQPGWSHCHRKRSLLIPWLDHYFRTGHVVIGDPSSAC